MRKVYTRKAKKLLALIKLSTNARTTALSVTFGFYFGIFPVIGATTMLCIIAALIFRLDHLITQLVNWLVFPLQILFIIPFYKTGGILLANYSPVATAQKLSFSGLLSPGSIKTISEAITSAIGGIVVWGLFTATTFYFVYMIVFPICRRYFALKDYSTEILTKRLLS